MAKIHSSSSVPCYVDGKVFPLALLNEHHVRPQAFGGDDSPENKKYLCPTCHQSLHRLADLMLAGKTGSARSLAGAIFSDPAQTAKVLALAVEAAKWERKFQTETPDYAKGETYREIKIKVDANTYRRLLTLSVEAGMKRSVPKMVMKMVKSVLDTRFSKPAQTDDEDDGFEGLE
jgi:hypothetical protein